ncbi:MAG: glycosyltransferase family 4 protein, partial [Candidatus Thorarchaeota archaeon]
LHATGTTTEVLTLERYPRIVSECIPNLTIISEPPNPTMTKSELLEELDLPPNSTLILTVGNINFRKALHKILDASSILSGNTNIQFVIVGKTANFISRMYLRAALKRANSNRIKNFHLTGFVSDELLHNLYSYADIFLSVSQSEACNLALIEAASYGIPIITTEVGAAKDLFERETTLLPRNSTVNEIVSSITKKLGLPRIRYESLENLSEKNTVQEMLKFYQKILQKPRST